MSYRPADFAAVERELGCANFARRVRRARAMNGLTQKECAEAMGCFQSDWADYEGGRTYNPSIITVRRIAAAMSMTLCELMEGL